MFSVVLKIVSGSAHAVHNLTGQWVVYDDHDRESVASDREVLREIAPDSAPPIKISAQLHVGVSCHSFRQACKHRRRQGLLDFTKGHPIAGMASDLMALMIPPASLTCFPQGSRHLLGCRLAHFSTQRYYTPRSREMQAPLLLLRWMGLRTRSLQQITAPCSPATPVTPAEYGMLDQPPTGF